MGAESQDVPLRGILPQVSPHQPFNEQGVEQIPVEYDHLYSFENGITIAKKDGRYGAIDLNNNTVIPFDLPYEDVRGFRDGRASVRDANGKWGVIDTKGELIIPCTSDNIV